MTKQIKALLLGFFLFLTGAGIAAEINDLNTTDASNTARFPENMAPSAVNDAARALEGIIARGLRDTVDGYVLTTGTSSALLVAANRTLTAYYDGLTQTVEWHTTPNASATVNLDSVGAKSLVWPNGTAVAANELISGARSIIQYRSATDKFQVLTLQGAAPTISSGIDGQIAKISGTSGLTASGITSTSISLVGKRTIWIPASAMLSRTTSGPAISKAELSSNKVMVNGLAFDGTTYEYAQFTVSAPKSWNESTVTALFDWTAASGSGTVHWYLQCLARSDDDAIDTAFGTASGITDTFITAHDEHLSSETSAITCSGTPAENDLLFFQAYRDGSADSNTSDATLLGIRLFMTTSGQNDE